MEKPILPVAPNPLDKKKYPKALTKEGRNYLGEAIFLANPNFLKDYSKYQKDQDRYNRDIIIWNQIKLIEAIKRTSLKTCLKKYKINKI